MYIYIINCEDNSLYTGVAKNIEHRLKEHKNKLPAGAKYTKSHSAKSLVALWLTEDKSAAYKLEYYLKKLSRLKKLEIILNNDNLLKYLENVIDVNVFSRQDKETISKLNSEIF